MIASLVGYKGEKKMIWKEYIHSMKKWEVVWMADRMEDDVRVGFYNTREEADSAMSTYISEQ